MLRDGDFRFTPARGRHCVSKSVSKGLDKCVQGFRVRVRVRVRGLGLGLGLAGLGQVLWG